MATAKKTTRKTSATRKPAAKATAPVDRKKAKDAAKAAPKKAEPKPKKPRIVRDSFNIPKAELAVLDELKARAARLGQPAKKSEVLRAGMKALAALGDAAFLATVNAVGPAKAARNAPKANS